MKKKKLLCLAVVTTMMFSMLTGCGKAADQTAEVTEESKQEKTEESTQEKTEETTQDNTEADSTAETEDGKDTSKGDGKTYLTYIGHASVKIVTADGTVIYVDPNYAMGDYSDKADYVFVTHGHDDHQPCDKLQKNDDCVMITQKESLHDGVYEKYDFGNFQVETVPAANANHDIKECTGYIFTVDGVKIYHAGDTSMIDQMKDLTDKNIDYAMYPIDGTYNMDAEEATEVANLVGAKNNIPIHEFDDGNTKKSDKFTPEGRLVLEYGETIVVSE